nr:aldehyde ferredoxin oxidoreductase C-terminal domain-containing protein [Desulfitibacter alkalitolerans]
MGNYETVKMLKKKHGFATNIMSIGPAGEWGYAMATVAVTDMEGNPARHCGRGGMGAVMGSKGIKAIIIDDSGAPPMLYKNKDLYRKLAANWAQELVKTKKVLTDYGTANLVTVINSLGYLPTRNFSSGTFEGVDSISGEMLKETIEKRKGKPSHACQPGCPIRRSNVYNDDKGNYLTAGFEYETIGLIGPNCGIGDLDFIAGMDRTCDDLGLDTMELGVTMGIIMDVGMIPFGDKEKMLQLVEEVKMNTLLGKLIGQGAALTGRVVGAKRIPVVKGQGISCYDPRGGKATGVTYATSPMGADHTAGNCLPGRTGYRPITNDPNFLNTEEGTIQLSKEMQYMMGVFDYSGICCFVGPASDSVEWVAKLINVKLGSNLTLEDMLYLSKKMIKNELLFNQRAGIEQSGNVLPQFFYQERLTPNDYLFNISQEKLVEAFNELDEIL